MSERFIDTGFWNNGYVQNLSADATYFLIYSRTNVHVNQAGFYNITQLTMIRETKLEEKRLVAALKELHPEVMWYPEIEYLWSRSFLKINFRSPKFLTAAAKSLRDVPDPKLIREFIRYNAVAHNIQIPYTYPTDTLSIPSAQETDQKISGSGSGSGSDIGEGERGPGGEGEAVLDAALAQMFTAYDQNIGKGKVTNVVKEQLVWIRDNFPVQWFMEALAESVRHEKRSLAYIEKILENWNENGYKAPMKDKKTGNGPKGKTEGLEIE
ncbi:MAG: DnaD domain protein [Syntrophales bacterium]|nr:DnaD domain protein [Syntrophales bacterium]